jgi:hypothetical protein
MMSFDRCEMNDQAAANQPVCEIAKPTGTGES